MNYWNKDKKNSTWNKDKKRTNWNQTLRSPTAKTSKTSDHEYGYNSGLLECVTGPGEMLYFPSSWMHATLNVDEYNVFMSLFLDFQLIPKS